MAKTLSAASAIIVFTVPPIFPVPVQLQGFGPDDVFDTPEIEAGQTVRGVDGRLSGGFVFAEQPQTYTLQADSGAIGFFDNWFAANVSALDAYPASASITLPALQQKYALTRGFLVRIPSMPSAKKLIQMRRFTVNWESITFSPM